MALNIKIVIAVLLARLFYTQSPPPNSLQNSSTKIDHGSMHHPRPWLLRWRLPVCFANFTQFQKILRAIYYMWGGDDSDYTILLLSKTLRLTTPRNIMWIWQDIKITRWNSYFCWTWLPRRRSTATTFMHSSWAKKI